MQPCQVCGGMAIDVNGYCTQCGTFRGQAAQSVSGAPVSGYPPQPAPYQQQPPGYPASGVPYTPATSGPPGYPNQVSAPPTSGAPGFPGYPAPPQRSRSFTGPLIAGSAILVVLVAAIVVVAIVRSGGKTDPNTLPTPSDGASPTAAVDPCLVGTWRITRDQEQIDIPGVGPVQVSGQGTQVTIKADGSIVQDYAGATPYEGQANGHTLTITATGTITGTITTSNGTMSFHGLKADGTLTAAVDGSQAGSTEPLDVNSDPMQYTCVNTTATETTSQIEISMSKLSG